MRFTSTLLAPLVAAASLATATQCPNVPGMKAVWQDEFVGCAGCPPNQDAWKVALNINTNNELQTYTQSNLNLQLSGGDTLQLVPWKGPQGEWTSGRIESKESWNPQPGKAMQVQAALRMGTNANKKGMWPAFWMLGDSMRQGTPWPRCGEIDIMEQVNGDPTGYGTVHCQETPGGACNEPTGRGNKVSMPQDSEFHTWAVRIDRTSNDWKTESIQWTLDGKGFHSLTGAEIGDQGVWATLAHSPMYVLLNVAVGGNWPVSLLFSFSPCIFFLSSRLLLINRVLVGKPRHSHRRRIW